MAATLERQLLQTEGFKAGFALSPPYACWRWAYHFRWFHIAVTSEWPPRSRLKFSFLLLLLGLDGDGGGDGVGVGEDVGVGGGGVVVGVDGGVGCKREIEF